MMSAPRQDRSHRKRDRNQSEQSSMDVDIDNGSPVVKLFRGYRQELDERHDRHERLVKLSRDITIESKRTIFLLHRVGSAANPEEILQETEQKLLALEDTKFREVAKELVGTDLYQFVRAYSAGLQEYIEALTFYFYLTERRLISLQEVTKRLTFTESPSTTSSSTGQSSQEVAMESGNMETDTNVSESSVSAVKNTSETGSDATIGGESDTPVSPMEDSNVSVGNSSLSNKINTLVVYIPPLEYILGLADLTGELMRKAISSVADGDLEQPAKICTFLQEMEAAYTSLGNSNREVNRKLSTLRQSLRKVETACYTLQVRGSEIPKHMLVDVLSKDGANLYIDDNIAEND